MQKILFRADAGYGIGYGHFIRTLALADMLKGDFDCIFYTSEPTPYQVAQMKGVCSFVALEEKNKFHQFLDCLKGDEIVVLDNYFFTTDYQRRIKAKGCKLVCIDDLHDKHYLADLIINQAINVSIKAYSCESYTRFAFGLGYSLLRKPFFDACKIKEEEHPTKGKEKLDVVVAFGGSDYLDLTSKVITNIVEMDIINRITAIVGDAYSSEIMIKSPKVHYQKNLSAEDIANLFSISDIAILPASTIMNEALACGITIIGGYFVNNQESDYNAFNMANMIYGAGDFTEANALSRIKFLLNRISEKDGNTISSVIPFRFIELFKSL
jgi:UDP-2,4-diacetamido-2,4,6-trideoxy-beta-L-altropyranose hydrolase